MKLLLLISLVTLSLQLHFSQVALERSGSEMVLQAEQGHADMALRNVDFPETFINEINVDLTSPHHWVHLSWSGPEAGDQEQGPFHSSPGAGRVDMDCNDFAQSNRGKSCCTPKGTRLVEGFSDFMGIGTRYKYVTWFHSSREIGLHSHPEVPEHPASSGCVRLNEHAAQLIHNNSIVGKTKVNVGGTWTRKGELENAQANQPDPARNLSR